MITKVRQELYARMSAVQEHVDIMFDHVNVERIDTCAVLAPVMKIMPFRNRPKVFLIHHPMRQTFPRNAVSRLGLGMLPDPTFRFRVHQIRRITTMVLVSANIPKRRTLHDFFTKISLGCDLGVLAAPTLTQTFRIRDMKGGTGISPLMLDTARRAANRFSGRRKEQNAAIHAQSVARIIFSRLMAVNISNRLSANHPLVTTGFGRDSRFLTAAALAQANGNSILREHAMSFHRVPCLGRLPPRRGFSRAFILPQKRTVTGFLGGAS